MADELSIKITNGVAFYVSDSEYMNSDGNFHYGFIQKAPIVTLSTTRNGWASFQYGTLVLENRPNDPNHPFGSALTGGGSVYTYYTQMLKEPSRTYPFRITMGFMNFDWVFGMLALQSISEATLMFSMFPTEYTNSPVGTVTDNNGVSVNAPWTYGAVTFFDSMVRIEDVSGSPAFQNPTGLTTGLSFHDDATSRTIDASSSTVLQVNAYSGGVPSVTQSGTKSIEDFFDYVATTLSLDVSAANTSKATNASSINVKIRQTEPEPLVELAGKVAQGFNYIFFIGADQDNSNRSTLFLIDRDNNPASYTTLEEDQIITASYNMGVFQRLLLMLL